jgi:hypothetical protein
MAERVIHRGEPGTFWTNDTGKVQYQFIAALDATCGCCLQYHTAISSGWPIPIHNGCMCIQRAVKQRQVAPNAFCDFHALLDRMDDAGKHAAVGRPNYALLSSGLATWGDIVTPNRVREFHEVMDRKRLTVDQMVMHGVDRLDAEEAWALVHTPEREAVDRLRRELLQKIAASGVSQEELLNASASRLAQRVGLETPANDKSPRKRKPRASMASGREVDERTVSDDVLKAISEKRVLEALGPVDSAKVTTTIVRDANGWPSAKFACPDDLKEKLREYIERVQSG